jgi:8-oxo-dGTP pyrophosphatase MutT (NUDIX family)
MTKSDAPDLVDILNSDDHPLTPCTAVAAIITVAGQGYLMQLRDPIPGIFYPGHWGLFGGGAEDGEGEIATLKRELEEELRLSPDAYDPVRFFAMRFQFDFLAGGTVDRVFYTLEIEPETLAKLHLAEGSAMKTLTWREVLDPSRPVAPYDSFALWVHYNRDRISKEQLDAFSTKHSINS